MYKEPDYNMLQSTKPRPVQVPVYKEPDQTMQQSTTNQTKQ